MQEVKRLRLEVAASHSRWQRSTYARPSTAEYCTPRTHAHTNTHAPTHAPTHAHIHAPTHPPTHTPPKVPHLPPPPPGAQVWGRPAEVIRAPYTDAEGARHENLLLVCGYHGLVRHFHYIPDIALLVLYCGKLS